MTLIRSSVEYAKVTPILLAAFSKELKRYVKNFEAKHAGQKFKITQSPGLTIFEYDSPDADKEVKGFYGKFGMGFALKAFEKIGIKFKIEKVE